MATSFIPLPVVMQKTTFSRSAIYSMVKTGDFPAPVHIGPRRVAWDENAVDNWMQSRLSATQAESIGG